MAITPIVVPAIGFTRFNGDNPNIAFDPTNLKAVYQFIESGNLVNISKSNIYAALRSIFSGVLVLFQQLQLLELQLTDLKETEQALQQELGALNDALADVQAELNDAQNLLNDAQAQYAAVLADPNSTQAEIDAASTDVALAQDNLGIVQEHFEFAQQEVNQKNQEIQLNQSRIQNSQNNIAFANEEMAVQVSTIQTLRNQIVSEDVKEDKTNISLDKLVNAALSLPSEADSKKQKRDEARFEKKLTDLNYETYKDIVYNLVREALAARELANEQTVQLTPKQVGSVFFEFGIDPQDIEVSTQDPAAQEILKPLTDIVTLLVLQQEIQSARDEQVALANRRTQPQTTSLSLGQVQPLALAMGQPPARVGDLPAEGPRERGSAGSSTSEDSVIFSAQQVILESSDFNVLKDSENAAQKLIGTLIDIKIAQANELKYQIEKRTGIKLSFITDDEPRNPDLGPSIVDRSLKLGTDKSTPAEAADLAPYDDGVNTPQDRAGSVTNTTSSDDQRDKNFNTDRIRIPV